MAARQYNPQLLDSALQRAGYNLTADDTALMHQLIRNNLAENPITRAWHVACYFLQSLGRGEGFQQAWASSARVADQRTVEDGVRSLRVALHSQGGEIARAADFITGYGASAHPADVYAQVTRENALTPDERTRGTNLNPSKQGPQPQRYAVVNTTVVTPPPPTPSVGATPALTAQLG